MSAQADASYVLPYSIGGVRSQMRGRGPSSTRIAIGPTFSSKTKWSTWRETIPSASNTKLVPIVGCPAKISSLDGVKILTFPTQSDRVAENTKVVSDRLSSLAILCIVSSSRPDASGKTAKEFPSKGWLVKTSTTKYRYDR